MIIGSGSVISHKERSSIAFLKQKQTQRRQSYGFTIVELLIVIVVIAILATIVTVAFNGIRERTVDSIVRNSLSDAVKVLETKKVSDSTYPGSLEATGLVSDENTTYQYAYQLSNDSYCLSSTSPRSKTIAYHTTSADKSIQQGVCEGHTPPGEEVVVSYVRSASSGGPMNLTVTTNEDWSNIRISWNAVPGVARYEVESRNSSTAGWYNRMTADGSSSCGVSCQGQYSGNVPSSTTSLTWTSPMSVPRLAGNHYEYRIRTIDGAGVQGAWEQVALENIIMNSDLIPTIANFKSSLSADWSNIQLTWDAPSQFIPDQSQVFYEVESRVSSTAGWYNRMTADGSSSCGVSCKGQYSGNVSNSLTSLTWTNATSVPRLVGNKYEYRIRVRVTGAQTYNGPWSTAASSNPIQSSADIPSVSSLSVVNEASWANITISWPGIEPFIPTMGQVFYEVQARDSPTGLWYYRTTANGSTPCSGGCYGTYSGNIPLTTTSLTWTSGVPTPGSTYEYRVRLRVVGEVTLYSNWTTKSLTR